MRSYEIAIYILHLIFFGITSYAICHRRKILAIIGVLIMLFMTAATYVYGGVYG